MAKYAAVISSVALSLISLPALGQASLGELLDAGGKKLSKTEVIATLGGANLSGPSKTGGAFQVDFKADGSFTGSVQSAASKSGGLFGTWTVDESGKVCFEFTSSLGSAGSSRGSNCAFFYKSGDSYFVAESDTDRGTPLLKRTIKK